MAKASKISKGKKSRAKNLANRVRMAPRKSSDIPVTQSMLLEVRNELKMDIRSLEKKMDSRFSAVDARFSAVDSRFSDMESRFSAMDAKFDKVLSEIHRVGLLVEDQNARNKFVLDGYTSVSDRLDKHEAEIAEIKKTLESF